MPPVRLPRHLVLRTARPALAGALALLAAMPGVLPPAALGAEEARVITIGADNDGPQRLELLRGFGARGVDGVKLVEKKDVKSELGGLFGGGAAYSSTSLACGGDLAGLSVETPAGGDIPAELYALVLVAGGVQDGRLVVATPTGREGGGGAALAGLLTTWGASTCAATDDPASRRDLALEAVALVSRIGGRLEEDGTDRPLAAAARLVLGVQGTVVGLPPVGAPDLDALVAARETDLDIALVDDERADLIAYLERISGSGLDWGAFASGWSTEGEIGAPTLLLAPMPSAVVPPPPLLEEPFLRPSPALPPVLLGAPVRQLTPSIAPPPESAVLVTGRRVARLVGGIGSVATTAQRSAATVSPVLAETATRQATDLVGGAIERKADSERAAGARVARAVGGIGAMASLLESVSGSVVPAVSQSMAAQGAAVAGEVTERRQTVSAGQALGQLAAAAGGAAGAAREAAAAAAPALSRAVAAEGAEVTSSLVARREAEATATAVAETARSEAAAAAAVEATSVAREAAAREAAVSATAAARAARPAPVPTPAPRPYDIEGVVVAADATGVTIRQPERGDVPIAFPADPRAAIQRDGIAGSIAALAPGDVARLTVDAGTGRVVSVVATGIGETTTDLARGFAWLGLLPLLALLGVLLRRRALADPFVVTPKATGSPAAATR